MYYSDIFFRGKCTRSKDSDSTFNIQYKRVLNSSVHPLLISGVGALDILSLNPAGVTYSFFFIFCAVYTSERNRLSHILNDCLFQPFRFLLDAYERQCLVVVHSIIAYNTLWHEYFRHILQYH